MKQWLMRSLTLKSEKLLLSLKRSVLRSFISLVVLLFLTVWLRRMIAQYKLPRDGGKANIGYWRGWLHWTTLSSEVGFKWTKCHGVGGWWEFRKKWHS